MSPMSFLYINFNSILYPTLHNKLAVVILVDLIIKQKINKTHKQTTNSKHKGVEF